VDKPAGESPQEKEVKSMKKSLIPFAGIFIACILCAGIPAVAAAENPNTSATPSTTIRPAETPQPWYTPIADFIGIHPQSDSTGRQSTQQVQPATSQNTQTEKTWWENLFPSEWVKENPKESTSAQDPAPAQEPVQNKNPAPLTTQSPPPATAQDKTPAHAAESTPSSTPSTPEKPQNSPQDKTP
jgi:hypothetical protein